MHERTQFIWGATAILIWLVTLVLIWANAGTANSIRYHYLFRETNHQEGWRAWNEAGATLSPGLTQSALLSSVGCNATAGLWAPICACLLKAYSTYAASSPASPASSALPPSSACVAKQASAQVTACFMGARRVQRIHIQDATVNPYEILLMLNSWSAIVGAVLLVRGKLEEQGSVMLQLGLQVLIFLVTTGASVAVFEISILKFIPVIVVAAAVIGFGMIADEDPHAWYIYQFHLLFAAGCPTLMVLFNAYTHRLEAVYFTATVALALVLGLAAAAKTQLERLSPGDPHVQYWDPATWARVLLAVLTACLIFQTYDEGDRGPTLKSSFYAWVGLTVYFSIAMHSVRSVSHMLYTDAVVRAVLTTAMLNELINA